MQSSASLFQVIDDAFDNADLDPEQDEEENEIELEPPSSLRPGRGFRPSTKREQIRMKLHQSKKKVWTFFNCLQ